LALDKNDDARIRLNFNITMTDLRCDWAVIDVVSVLGTDQNVTAHVTKWNLDGNGVRRGYKGRNRNQKDIALFDETVTETIEELLANGEDAISLDAETLELYKKEHDYLFVDFYASWCSHCHDLAPTWEALAEVMLDAGQQLGKQHPDDYSDEDYEKARKVVMPVVIAKVDCVQHPKVCNVEENIKGYPTLRLFVDGQPWSQGDYRGHRTIIEMVEWLYYMEEQHKGLLDDDANVRTLHAVHEGKRTFLSRRYIFGRIVFLPCKLPTYLPT
jgi:thiol-disulfide isomerase/thioredoxin